MIDNFRSRMSELRQEMDSLTNQAEDLERVAREQQDRLEEMELLVRQRDEQLADQQTRVEELEATLKERNQELDELGQQMAEQNKIQTLQSEEMEDLRTQLAQREETIRVLSEELVQAKARIVEPEPGMVPDPLQEVVERFASLENRVHLQDGTLIQIRSLLQEEMSRLHERLDRIETTLTGTELRLAPAAVEISAPPEKAPALFEEVEVALEPAPVIVEEPLAVVQEIEVALEEAPAVVKEIAVAPPEVVPPEVAVAVADPLQALLYEALANLPPAMLVGLAGHDGLNVETVAREEGESAPDALPVELADLTSEAQRAVSALGTGTLLTLAFQVGELQYLVSPVNADYFAYILTAADSADQFRYAQAILLQAASRLKEMI